MISYKKILCLLVAALILLFLSACSDEEAASSSSTSSSVATSDTADSEAAAEDDSATAEEDDSAADASAADSEATSDASATAEDASATSAVSMPATPAPAEVSTGKFLPADDGRFPAERSPYLQLNEDGSGIFHVNTGLELGEILGSYVVSGSTLTFTIESSPEFIEAYQGFTATTLRFNVLGDDYLAYSGDAYGLTLPGNLFTKEGAPPYDPNAAASSEPSDESASQPTDESTSQPTSDTEDTEDTEDDQSVDIVGAVSSMLAPEPSIIIAPPSTLQLGDSFELSGITDAESLVYDEAFFEVATDEDSITFTAIQAGETTIAVAGSEEENAHTITIEESASEGGIPLWILILVAGLSIVLGAAVPLILFLISRKKKGKAAPVVAEDSTTTALSAKPADKAAKKRQKALKKAKKKEKAVLKKVAKLQKKSAKAKKNSDKWNAATEKAVAQASKALDEVRNLTVLLTDTPATQDDAAADGGQDSTTDSAAASAPAESIFGESSSSSKDDTVVLGDD